MGRKRTRCWNEENESSCRKICQASSDTLNPPPGLEKIKGEKYEPTLEQTDEDSLCCICKDYQKDHIVVPCGHMCFCGIAHMH